ncbi:sulfate adenylyltransferase subunit CysN [Chelatococcus asaccharovorans]|uniref:sulfate adenylyltransferase subunit CysN n=1 Tax=Chelatococcus asaccharovorans TaxID=28210 RepID=UPI00224C738F|nr:sulfate adenylyltransferase subunit CysN [Chelatococcus asaccharovorans]CAH1654104.1 Sulfate adenylyltransferase subunit 1 / Adenylyl-sulfate kinase [Chelatococcus asaccharovorans]CAH1685843.1 Sulfate adenylyltransferase subunit 1 / Adenylyl-sulfate kinase [Chelatococcus asaccharovorans]
MAVLSLARAADAHAADLLPADRGLLRFITCGSVDDGKSTLIGRLLFETHAVFDDQLVALEADSRRVGTTGDDIDFALLVDGLEQEREQGITIDVAHRYFSTPRRSFIVADTPGHEQYTRNMATGASNAELAIILVDARKGLLTQTRRHSLIAALMGIRHIVVAINKIDLVGYDEARFRTLTADYARLAEGLGFASITPIPLSARFGDNVSTASAATPWYDGPTLLGHLETVDVEETGVRTGFRFPVQWVNRPDQSFRGFSGTVAGGTVAVGDAVVTAVSGHQSRIARIVTFDGDLERASAGDAVTLVLADEIDVPRGDVLVTPRERPSVASRLSADIVWMGEDLAVAGRSYLLKIGTRTVPARISAIDHSLDVETLGITPAVSLGLNAIGQVEIETLVPIAFDAYADNRATGAFILIDRFTHATVAAGLAREARGATNVHRHGFDVDRDARAALKRQRPLAIWLTGLPGSGKSTIANLLERKLHALGRHTAVLDGDSLRQGLNADLGFDAAARAENVRRAAEVARLMVDAGLIVICAFVSPFRDDRANARARFADGDFLEVFVDAPLEVCAERDPKGLYAGAREGRIATFTGVGQAYEPPLSPDVHLDAAGAEAHALAEQLLAVVERRITGAAGNSEDSAAL